MRWQKKRALAEEEQVLEVDACRLERRGRQCEPLRRLTTLLERGRAEEEGLEGGLRREVRHQQTMAGGMEAAQCAILAESLSWKRKAGGFNARFMELWVACRDGAVFGGSSDGG